MAEPDARARRAAERRQQILDAARAVAEAEGWAAVTSRRLADAIGYTQPVLYSHFPGGKTEIMRTVALAGFAELAAATRAAMGRKTGAQADRGGGGRVPGLRGGASVALRGHVPAADRCALRPARRGGRTARPVSTRWPKRSAMAATEPRPRCSGAPCTA